jgi:hypothetical protein
LGNTNLDEEEEGKRSREEDFMGKLKGPCAGIIVVPVPFIHVTSASLVASTALPGLVVVLL